MIKRSQQPERRRGSIRASLLRTACLMLVVVVLASMSIIGEAHACRPGLSIVDRSAGVPHSEQPDETTADLDAFQPWTIPTVRKLQQALGIRDESNTRTAPSTRSGLSRSPPFSPASFL
jgi:hypothetical protein